MYSSLIKRKSLYPLVIILCVMCFFSCNSYKNLYYLENENNPEYSEYLNFVDYLKKGKLSKEDSLFLSNRIHQPRIMADDILSIVVSSSIKGASDDFNLPLMATNTEAQQIRVTSAGSNTGTLQNYLVDKEGYINFPVLGELRLSGMTISEAEEYIASLIWPHYIAKKPIVNIRQLNFSVSVLGEVKNPGIYKSENGKITILDALAAAGDMTIYGKRDDMLLVRTTDAGEILFYKIDLQDRNLVLDQNLFYLQQNDKLYVQPNKARGNSSRFGTLETVGLSSLSLVISVIAILTR